MENIFIDIQDVQNFDLLEICVSPLLSLLYRTRQHVHCCSNMISLCPYCTNRRKEEPFETFIQAQKVNMAK